MARGSVEPIGVDIRFSGPDLPDARVDAAGAVTLLRGWSERYDRAAARDDELALLALGQEIFVWLDVAGFASAWVGSAGDRELAIMVSGSGDPALETALLDAPWELLATDRGPLAGDDLHLFTVMRRDSATCG